MEFQGSQWESQSVTTNKRPIGPRMSNKRIDLTELEERFEDGLNWDDSDTMDLITELKKHYEILDEISSMWWCSPHLSEEHHANITKILAEYRGISHLL